MDDAVEIPDDEIAVLDPVGHCGLLWLLRFFF
jgi:hypothetical protein